MTKPMTIPELLADLRYVCEVTSSTLVRAADLDDNGDELVAQGLAERCGVFGRAGSFCLRPTDAGLEAYRACRGVVLAEEAA